MEEQKFRIGELVYETIRPENKLVIAKATGKLYHCRLRDDMNKPAIVYNERELKSEKDNEQSV